MAQKRQNVIYVDQEGGPGVTEEWRVDTLVDPDVSKRPKEAVTQGGWVRGAAHPDATIDAKLLRMSSRFLVGAGNVPETDRCVVTLNYGQQTTDLAKKGGSTGNGLLSIGVETFTEEMYQDAAGANMVVQYESNLGVSTIRGEKVAIATRQKVAWTATLSKAFSQPRYTDNMLYGGKVNNAAFGPAGTRELLFRGVAISEDSEGDFMHDYTFSWNADEWTFLSFITFGGLVPQDVEETYNPPTNPGGVGRFVIYEEADFSLLPVSFPPGV